MRQHQFDAGKRAPSGLEQSPISAQMRPRDPIHSIAFQKSLCVYYEVEGSYLSLHSVIDLYSERKFSTVLGLP